MQYPKNLLQAVIIGRPNVGKSTLLNALVKRMRAIVDPTPGTTRDRIAALLTIDDFNVEIIDTGGIDPDLLSGKKTRMGLDSSLTPEILWPEIQKQINVALKNAALILFVVDIRSGVTHLDEEINKLIHKENKPVILCINKADNQNLEDGQNEFYRFGWEMIALSALQKRGIDTLRDKIKEKLLLLSPVPDKEVLSELPASDAAPEDGKPLSASDTILTVKPDSREMIITIVGKRNVGKSMLVNALARQERTIVSEFPGTTRDSIDVRFERDGEAFLAIDTAGVKRKSKFRDAIETFSQQRTEQSITRADVVLLLIDARENVSDMDKKIANTILENNKPCVLVINKWDLVKKIAVSGDYQTYLNETMPFMSFAPVVLISALTGFNITHMVQVCKKLYRQAGLSVKTSLLNKIAEKIKARLPVSHRGAHQPRIYYVAQTGTYPPTITMMINNPTLFSKRAVRFIKEQLRKELPIKEVPIKLIIKIKKSKRP